MLKNTIAVLFIFSALLILWIIDKTLEIMNKEFIFDKKIYINEIIKFLIIFVSTLVLCLSIEAIPFILKKIDINISLNIITPIEIIGILITLYKSYISNIYNEIKKFLEKRNNIE